jgi:hypothetical protein
MHRLKRVSPSVIVYLVLGGIILFLRLLLRLFPSGQVVPQLVNLTDSVSILAIWLSGWVGVYLAPGTGFSGMWQADIPHSKRFLLPLLVGAAIGVVTILFDLLEPVTGESLIKFPTSLVAYPLAGILEEIIFRLFLTTTLVWIVSNMILRGRHQEGVFWGVSIFLSAFYTLSQIDAYNRLIGTPDLLTLARFFIVIAANFILAAYFYRRYGFLAAISMRMGDYFVWYILWGALVRG